jgi:FkbM family methyltransferase
MRVFLDIGSHLGETVVEVQKPAYGFDRIVCFEPASSCWPMLEKLSQEDSRVEICRFGLGAKGERLALFGAGSQAGSVLGGEGLAETVEIVDVAAWFRNNLHEEDFVVAKTNCEGAEIAIINRLLDEDLFRVAVTFLVTFDIRHFAEHQGEEAKLRRRLRGTGLTNFCFSDDVMIGTTHQRRIAHWLHLFGIDTKENRAAVENQFSSNFRSYSRKRGFRHQWEHSLKRHLKYSALPEQVKEIFRSAKRRLGLSRERDIPQA